MLDSPYPYVINANALATLTKFGKSAASAVPVQALSAEAADYPLNAKVALTQVGAAPPTSMPYLARLLDHQSLTVQEKAAKGIVQTASLKGQPFDGTSGEELILAVRDWWNQTGIKMAWSKN